MKTTKTFLLSLLAFLTVATSCQDFDELATNPNIAGEDAVIPPSFLLGRIL